MAKLNEYPHTIGSLFVFDDKAFGDSKSVASRQYRNPGLPREASQRVPVFKKIDPLRHSGGGGPVGGVLVQEVQHKGGWGWRPIGVPFRVSGKLRVTDRDDWASMRQSARRRRMLKKIGPGYPHNRPKRQRNRM